MWAGLDQRVFPRFSASCDITISGGGDILKAKTQNIGVGGVCLIFNKALEKFSQVKLRLVLDESLPMIECDAKVVWMIPSKEISSPKKHYDIGLEFLNIKASDLERIHEFIQKLNK